MPAVTRIGDIGSGHGCFPPSPAVEGSPDVFTNNIPTHRVGDAVQTHCCGSCHGRKQSAGSSTVFVNGKAIARIGDAINCGGAMAAGSPNVFAN